MTTADVQLRRWSREEYHKMADLGLFHGQRVELIDGEIVQMAAQKDVHFATLSLVGDALRAAFGNGYWVRLQGPLGFDEASEPEPDVSVVRGSSRDYIGTGHPAGALLVVEVSDTTLRYDRGDKASLYARHGIADYWIVNLVEGRVEVRREPVRDEGATHGWRYQAVTILQKGQTVTPLLLPQAKIVVADMLPQCATPSSAHPPHRVRSVEPHIPMRAGTPALPLTSGCSPSTTRPAPGTCAPPQWAGP